MTDVREQILSRLLALASGIEGINNAYRNRDEESEFSRPSIIIFDADEKAVDPIPEEPRLTSRPAYSPILITMMPGIELRLGAEPENVGSELSDFRVKILKTILNDGPWGTAGTLANLTIGGRIRYGGCSTFLGRGRSMEATMLINVAFTYLLNPAAL